MAVPDRTKAGLRVPRNRQAALRHAANIVLLRRTGTPLRQRGLCDFSGSELRGGKLGGRGILERADRWPGYLQPETQRPSSARLLRLAQPARSPARAAHAGRIGGILFRERVRRRCLYQRRQQDARWGGGLLGRSRRAAPHARFAALESIYAVRSRGLARARIS